MCIFCDITPVWTTKISSDLGKDIYWLSVLFLTWFVYLCCISIIPPLQWSWKGGILVSPCPSVRPSFCPSIHLSLCPSVPLSVCGQNHVRSVSSTILIGSISYLHILSSNLRRCVVWNASFKIKKFDFVFFWLGIQYDSMVWVIMRQWGLTSEHRRSSCSSIFCFCMCFQASGLFKNAHEPLNLRALKITMLFKSHIFQCMG